MNPPVGLTVAGSDSGGGAGAQADLRTMSALGVHCATAMTLLTAQNTLGIQGIQPVPAHFVAAQIDAVLADLAVAAVKTGMLGSAEVIEAVAAIAEADRLPNLVVDPVLVSSTGAPLFDPTAVDAYRTRLLPRALVITPNRAEAELLAGGEIRSVADQRDAATHLAESGCAWVVVKGGGRSEDPSEGRSTASSSGADTAVDVVVEAATGTIYEIANPWVDTVNVHGSGCSLAAATVAYLAKGIDPLAAITAANTYVTKAIAGGAEWSIGGGHGPLDHFGWNKPA